ncbi:hypothetical protein CVM73_19465 [Bradyrhizobium forestalis]|uniref:Uncharacterized protein n=1 Tax=Bradyrhizobium forestalis TaxID=1419263 RepID=A0A2M8R767_9BRAD|nr:hypothetical protein CVM73_19465 [Bradyrhizobium forestalis]
MPFTLAAEPPKPTDWLGFAGDRSISYNSLKPEPSPDQKCETFGTVPAFQIMDKPAHDISLRTENDRLHLRSLWSAARKCAPFGEAFRFLLARQHGKCLQRRHQANEANSIMWLTKRLCDKRVCVAQTFKDRR